MQHKQRLFFLQQKLKTTSQNLKIDSFWALDPLY